MFVMAVGYIALTMMTASFLRYMAKYFRSPIDVRSIGDWALVTGATDGIGKCFCVDLAKKGMNIILVSRSEIKLEEVASEIRKKYNVDTKIIVIDFIKEKKPRKLIETTIQDLNVGLLINNVGMSYAHPEYFLQVEDGESCDQALVDCNISSLLSVTRAVLPSMVARRKGAVINISSFAASFCPLLSVYSASKAFVSQFSSNLEVEYRDSGITIMCASPYYVVSNMSRSHQIYGPAIHHPTALTYASSVLAQLGTATFTYGYWAHDLVGIMASLAGPLAPIIIHGVLKNIRKTALKEKCQTVKNKTN